MAHSSIPTTHAETPGAVPRSSQFYRDERASLAGTLLKGTVPLPGGATAIYSGTSGMPCIRRLVFAAPSPSKHSSLNFTIQPGLSTFAPVSVQRELPRTKGTAGKPVRRVRRGPKSA